ncbi:MAG: MBL fold metallo-hydrolase [Ferruginibacter sp.]
MMKPFLTCIAAGLILTHISCHLKESLPAKVNEQNLPDRFLVVLGIAQDAGYPQIGCEKECCKAFWNGEEDKKFVTCLAMVDRKANQYWLFEATPDIAQQLHTLQPYLSTKPDYSPQGIFITHAHIGHYSGLMQFGREAMGAKAVSVWAMPRLDSFLRNNGPWNQLISLNNIQLQNLHADSTINLNSALKVTPFKVPHRDEFSETVGFIIESGKKKILFIPDIDKWEKWDRNIEAEIKKVDMALLDGTFYESGELPGRNMNEVPHPFVEESMQRFSALPSTERSKIRFIHFNHTNPLLKKQSAAKDKVTAKGFAVTEEGMIIEL